MSICTRTALDVETTCSRVLDLLLKNRRTNEKHAHDPSCFTEQIAQLAEFVSVGDPILFALPAFPCKSPNPAKVLGHLPDMGELLSLRFLNSLCGQIAKIYPPGARILICSDGHVFGDLIGVSDKHIDEYMLGLRAMIADERMDTIDTYDLREVYGGQGSDGKRDQLVAEFAAPLDELREEVRSGGEAVNLYRGITKFLVEDSIRAEGVSKSALQRECRERAYGVIQRSRAWGELLAQHHPRSFRLSIHPQPCHSTKFGIALLDTKDTWLTPWHAAAVQQNGRFTLMKRSEAEKIGSMVSLNGRPSHYTVAS